MTDNEALEKAAEDFRWVTVSNKEELKSLYEKVLPEIRAAAKMLGYAIGVHGSMERDLDLIAVPWTEVAADKEILARAIHRSACGLESQSYAWESKPHGRVATCFPICFPEFNHGTLSLGHIDLSVWQSKRDAEKLCLIKEALSGLLKVSRECANDYEYGENGYEFYRLLAHEALKKINETK